MTARSSLIYFMKPVGLAGPVKIGCTRWLGNRLDALSAWSPFRLEVLATAPGNYMVESAIHQCFAYAHSHKEWFHPVPKLLEAIENIRTGMTLDDAIDLTAKTGHIRKYAKRRSRAAMAAEAGAA